MHIEDNNCKIIWKKTNNGKHLLLHLEKIKKTNKEKIRKKL